MSRIVEVNWVSIHSHGLILPCPATSLPRSRPKQPKQRREMAERPFRLRQAWSKKPRPESWVKHRGFLKWWYHVVPSNHQFYMLFNHKPSILIHFGGYPHSRKPRCNYHILIEWFFFVTCLTLENCPLPKLLTMNSILTLIMRCDPRSLDLKFGQVDFAVTRKLWKEREGRNEGVTREWWGSDA